MLGDLKITLILNWLIAYNHRILFQWNELLRCERYAAE